MIMRSMFCIVALTSIAISRTALSALPDETDKWDTLGKIPTKEYRVTLKAFKHSIAQENAADKEVAVMTFSTVEDYRVIDELNKLISSRDPNLKTAAVTALGHINDQRAARALFNALKRLKNTKQDVKTLVLVINGLGKLSYWQACSKIKDLLDHSDPTVKAAAIYALGEIVPAKYVPDIIKLYANDKKALAQEEKKKKDEKTIETLTELIQTEQSALQTITGETFDDPADYTKWWKKNRSLFEAFGGLRDGVTPRPIKKPEGP